MNDGPSRSAEVLAVCGLAFEARVAAGQGVRTLTGAGRSDALASAIEQAIADGVVGLVSFGVAGALVPDFEPGALLVANAVIGPDGSHATHTGWRRALMQRLPAARDGSIAGVDRIVTTPAEKAQLRRRTDAVAVDMESHIVARIAAAHGLPFIVLRAIADPLDRTLPPAAMVAMREDGRVDLAAVLRSLLRDPLQLPSLLRVGLDSRRALRALGEGRGLLGRGLGHADLDQLLLDVI